MTIVGYTALGKTEPERQVILRLGAFFFFFTLQGLNDLDATRYFLQFWDDSSGLYKKHDC